MTSSPYSKLRLLCKISGIMYNGAVFSQKRPLRGQKKSSFNYKTNIYLQKIRKAIQCTYVFK